MVGEEVVISGQEARHLALVLRLRVDEEVVVLSPDGGEFLAKIRNISPEEVKAVVLSRYSSGTDPVIQLTVAMGFLKEKKMDDLIRPLTELGMTRFQPFFAHRSISKPEPDRMTARVRRWEKIAQESIKQCRRGSVPEICPPVTFGDVLSGATTNDMKILFFEEEAPGASFPAMQRGEGAPSITIILGPEGGLTTDEVAAAKAAGFFICSLGPRILKAETAVVVACALIQYVYGDMGLSEKKAVSGDL